MQQATDNTSGFDRGARTVGNIVHLEHFNLVHNDQRLATLFDGISRHSPEGLAFKARVEAVGWKQAVRERDSGTYDWTRNTPIE